MVSKVVFDFYRLNKDGGIHRVGTKQIYGALYYITLCYWWVNLNLNGDKNL